MSTRPVIIVTGASKFLLGIGLAVTKILVTEFRVIVAALSRTKSPELAELEVEHDGLSFSECDVTNETVLKRTITQVEDTHKRIDGLVLNAAVLEPMCRIGSTETTLDEWKRHFDVNFFSLVTAIQAALPALRRSPRGSRIVFVSSGAAVKGGPGWGPYNASKAAMNSLCRTLCQEEPGVVSVALRPGMVDTTMQALIREKAAASLTKDDYEGFVRAHAEGRLVKPEQCGYVIAALSLYAPTILSGQFVSWDSEECASFRKD